MIIKDTAFTLKDGRKALLRSPKDEDIRGVLDYLYVSYSREDATPVAILHAAGYAEVEACLKNRGYAIL